MKKIVASILLLVAVLFVAPVSAFAVDYSIEKMRIDAHLQDNGNVNVTEQQTYDFDGKFKGITRTLHFKKGTKITDVRATEDGQALKVEQDGNEYKIYRSGKNEQVTIEFAYTIEGGVEKYTDAAQLYWTFFDTSNESDYGQVDVFVHPPVPTGDALAIGYGEAQGTAETEADGTVHFQMGKVSSGKAADIRAAYDADLFPNTALTKDKLIREEIQKEQAEQKAKQEAFEKRQGILDQIAPYIMAVFTIYVFALLLSAWRKKQAMDREMERTVSTPYFVPENEMSMPATIYYMRSGMIGAEVLSAAFLDLVRKGYVKQEKDDVFTVLNRETDYEHERNLISWMFDKVGKAGTFRLADLKAYTKKESNQTTYQKDYQTWQQAVRKEVKSNDLYQNKTTKRIWVALSGALLIIPIVLFGVHDLFMWMFIGIVLSMLLLLFAVFHHPKTPKGSSIQYKWKAFQEKYPKLDKYTWDEQHDDDQKRAFIYGLGMNDKQIKKKNEQLIESTEGTAAALDPNLLIFIIIASSLNTSFTSANNTASASSTGGTPGGGTGVGGSGGGSGAF